MNETRFISCLALFLKMEYIVDTLAEMDNDNNKLNDPYKQYGDIWRSPPPLR